MTAGIVAALFLSIPAHARQGPCTPGGDVQIRGTGLSISLEPGYFFRSDAQTFSTYLQPKCRGGGVTIFVGLRDLDPARIRAQVEADRQLAMRGWGEAVTPAKTEELANGARVYYFVGIKKDGKPDLISGTLEMDRKFFKFTASPRGPGAPTDPAIMRPWLDEFFGKLRGRTRTQAVSPTGTEPKKRTDLRPVSF